MTAKIRIRKAAEYDVDGIYACAVRFFEYAKYEEQHGMPLDEGSFKSMLRKYLKDGICFLAVEGVDVRGGICGMIMPWGFNQRIKVALELFYWMDEEYRGLTGMRLLAKYEDAVAKAGAKNIMIQPETELTEKVGRLYERKGYVPFERFWIK